MHYKTGTLWHSDASILFISGNVVLDKRHSDAFILFTSAEVPSHRLLVQKSFWIKDRTKFLQKQCTVCAAFADADMSFLERLMSGRSSFPWSCILPPLPRFRAVTCYRPLWLQTCHMWRWLTFAKLRMQNRCSLVQQTFLTNQDRPYTFVTEIAWNMQMSTNDNSINTRFCWQTCIRSRRDFHTFCYTDGL